MFKSPIFARVTSQADYSAVLPGVPSKWFEVVEDGETVYGRRMNDVESQEMLSGLGMEEQVSEEMQGLNLVRCYAPRGR